MATFLNVKMDNEDAEGEIYTEAACCGDLPISRDLEEENKHEPMFVHIALTLQESQGLMHYQLLITYLASHLF